MVQKLKNDKNRDDSLLFSWAQMKFGFNCEFNSKGVIFYFFPREARIMRIAVLLSVRPSVRHTCGSVKTVEVRACNFHRVVAPSL